MTPRARASAILLLACMTAGCAPLLPPAASAAPQRAAAGHLFIVGGGPRPAALMQRFVDLAGGPGRARIVVIPIASAEPEATGESQAAELRALGAEARVLVLDRAGASRPGVTAELEGVTGIWYSGGDQNRITAVLGGTPAEAAIAARYLAGAVVGGTSAGAAIMTTPMITGAEARPGGARPSEDAWITIERGNVITAEGLMLLPGAIVDQHFVRRQRHNRLIALILEQPSLVGAGIDEETALQVNPDGSWEVVGRSVVVIYDARRATVTAPANPLGGAGMRMHVLPAGGRFDPRTGRATLPGS
jgi:cyanophycinase